MDYNEFAGKIKAKFPDYADMDNRDLAQKMVTKFPTDYNDVTFDEQTQAQPKTSDLASTLYHGAIEGGAMAVGGVAGTVLAGGNPIGGVALGAAMYPPAKRAAEAIDSMRGISPDNQGPLKEYGQGLAIEAGSAALKPVAGAIGKILPGAKVGEALSGTPASNLTRAYNQGFWDTYIKPKTLSKASEAFGEAKFDMVGKTITPEEQASMIVNPNGEANKKVFEVMLKWLKGEPVTGAEALAARQGADAIFPADVAKSQARRGGLTQFKQAMNEVIGKENPAFAEANSDYAASKLRSQLLSPMRVNKANPDQYSKLGAMLNVAGGKWASLLGASPLGMGVISSTAGTLSRVAVPESVKRGVMSEFISRITQKDDQ